MGNKASHHLFAGLRTLSAIRLFCEKLRELSVRHG